MFSSQRPTHKPTKAYPVDDAFFQPLHLTKHRLAQLRKQVAETIEQTLAERDQYLFAGRTCSADWRMHAEYRNLRAYKRPRKTRSGSATQLRIVGALEGDYLENAMQFKTETRADYFTLSKKLFKQTVDATVLHTVHQEPTASPVASESVKWAVCEPFAVRFRRDTCHFESMGTGVDAYGMPYVYRVILPTVFHEMPEQLTTKRTVRMEIKNVMLLSPSECHVGSTDLFMAMGHDFKTHGEPHKLVKRFLASLQKLSSPEHAKYALLQNGWVAETPRQACAGCDKAFSILRPGRHCGVCCERVCRSCLVRGFRKLTPNLATQRHDKLKVCARCIRQTREAGGDGEAAETPVLGDEDDKPTWMNRHRTSNTSMTRAVTSFRSYTSSSSSGERGSSRPDWATTPLSRSTKSRDRTGTDQSWRTDSSRVSSSVDEYSAADGAPPIAIMDESSDERPSFEDSDVISEEDGELSSLDRSYVFTIDTSDMARASTPPPPSHSSATRMERIGSSLQEQELLLRQLQRAAGAYSVRSSDWV